MKPYDLEDVEILEVSLVDNPANQHASVVLVKNMWHKAGVKSENAGEANKGEGQVTVEELTKKLEALSAQVTDLSKKAADAETAKATAEAAAAALTKSAKDAGLDIEDGKIVKRADPEFVEIDGERIEKSLVPAPVLRAIEKQAAEIAQMQAKAEEVELAKRGETELPNLAGTGLAKGRLLAAVGKDEELLKALKAADAAMAKNYAETGHGDVYDEASPNYKLDQLAKAHAAARNVTFEVAYAEVTKDGAGADLLVQIRNEAH
jgi:type II secretory pathway component PulM